MINSVLEERVGDACEIYSRHFDMCLDLGKAAWVIDINLISISSRCWLKLSEGVRSSRQ